MLARGLELNKVAYQKYKKTSVESAGKEKLLLLMYEGAIKFIKKSILAVDNGNIAAKGENIGYAYDVIMELNNTLDHKIGGEIAASLEQLYMFITDKLVQANIENKREHLVDALKVTETLYSGWKEAIEKLKKQDVKAKKI